MLNARLEPDIDHPVFRMAGPFLAGLVEQEQYHVDLLELARAIAERSGWKASLFNPWQDSWNGFPNCLPSCFWPPGSPGKVSSGAKRASVGRRPGRGELPIERGLGLMPRRACHSSSCLPRRPDRQTRRCGPTRLHDGRQVDPVHNLRINGPPRAVTRGGRKPSFIAGVGSTSRP